MKILFVFFLSIGTLNAKADETILPCENVAQEIAAFVSKSAWGQSPGYIPVTTSRKFADGLYTFNISIKNLSKNEVIGESYEISVYRDSESEACVTVSLTSN